MRRGITAMGFGPLVLSVIYLILQQCIGLEMLTVKEVCTGMLSLSVLAFVAGGMNVIYQVEKIPLMVAILIHGMVLYISYLATYLVNGWLKLGFAPLLVFTAIFAVGYIAVWAVIYIVTKKRTDTVNKMLKQKQQNIKE